MNCPHCDVETIPHVGGLKDGTFHCNACGCCMYPNGKNREGHTGCGVEAPVKPKRTKKVTDGSND